MYPPNYEVKSISGSFATPRIETKALGDDVGARRRAAGHDGPRRAPASRGRGQVEISPAEVREARRGVQVPDNATAARAMRADREAEARRPRDRRSGSLDGQPPEPLPRGFAEVRCGVCDALLGATGAGHADVVCPACLRRATRRGGRG